MDLKSIISNIADTIKDILKLGPKGIVGVDIGMSSIKVAQVQKIPGKKIKLTRFSSVPLPDGAIMEDEVQNENAVIDAIVKALKKAKISSRSAVIGLKGPHSITKKLTLAGGSPEEIDDQVHWEAEQYLPFDLEVASLGFHVMGENEGGGVDIIFAAATNEVVERFKSLVGEADLRVKIIDMDITAVTNIFELVMGKKLDVANESYLILDIGAQKTNFIIYKNKRILFTKEIPVGGLMVTEEIQRQMGVNYSEAEDLKKSGDDKGNLPEEILTIIEESLNSFFGEIQKTYDFYVSSTSDESLVGCYITGGSAQLIGMADGLENILQVEVNYLNPFEHFEYDAKNLKGLDMNEVAFTSSVALGFAMRAV
ncbi:MAG: type IV pilus assembly protein PilM [Deltaproteobacteria bacterium]|nr:MAG: type IV pilus assembly protein PilM [Deltaproteobacteria bacterium]